MCDFMKGKSICTILKVPQLLLSFWVVFYQFFFLGIMLMPLLSCFLRLFAECLLFARLLTAHYSISFTLCFSYSLLLHCLFVTGVSLSSFSSLCLLFARLLTVHFVSSFTTFFSWFLLVHCLFVVGVSLSSSSLCFQLLGF